MEEQEMLALIEYARFHGLAQDHRAVPPLFSASIPSPPADYLLQLSDPEDVPHLALPPAFTTQEKLSLDREAATLLSACMWNAEVKLSQEELSIFAGQRRGKALKMELPILRTDHELDMRSFGRQVIPDLSGDNIPFEGVDDENDEGLSWPSASFDLPKIFEEKVKSEKLEVPKDAILRLQTVIRGECYTEDELAAVQGNSKYYKILRLEPTTPPLLPLSPLATPFLPSSSEGRLELLSDHTSPTAEDSRQFTEMLMDQDSLIPMQKEAQNDEDSSPDMADGSLSEAPVLLPSPLDVFQDVSSSPPRKHPPASKLLVEGPLTPPRYVPPRNATAKEVSLPEILQEIAIDISPGSGQRESSELEFEAFLNNTVTPVAENVNMKLAQEQLQESDSTLRVEVPPMDFSLNIAPWHIYHTAETLNEHGNALSQQKRLIQDIRSVYGREQQWPGTGRVDNELKWVPFPMEFGKVALKEVIQDGDYTEQYLAGLGSTEAVDLDGLVWKPKGLQILNDYDEELDEGKLSQGSSSNEQGLDSLARKRDINTDINCNETNKRIKANSYAHKREQIQPVRSPRRGLLETRGSFLLGASSTSNALEAFMHLRGVPLKVGSLSLPSMACELPKTVQSIGQPLDARDQRPHSSEGSSVGLPERAFQLPATPVLRPPRSFIVSSALLTQRRLMRRIQKLYPEAIFIERDFTPQLMSMHGPLKEASKTALGDLSDEADMIVSPSTGVIWTTLQKIKQRPLPGQSQKPGLREKATRLSQRYERLVVLVSEGQIDDGSARADCEGSGNIDGLNDKDCDALVELMGFAAASIDDIAVIFAAGGEEELAEWIVALMVKYGVTDKNVSLLQVETIWEVFLRRAGLNAFAAQVILSKLKQQDHTVAKESENFGLTEFVKMTPQQRIEKFEHLLGGRKLLERVGAQIDMKW